jgi:chorismate mutase/prephenate dehydrogenase
MEDNQLDKLRSQIKETDVQILALIRKRLDLAKEIGQLKFSSKIPVKDYKVEKEVLERNLAAGTELGLYEPLTTEITKLLIRYAVLTQDEFQSKEKRSDTNVKLKILIIGGHGNMGLWLSEFFDSFGHQVSHLDLKKNPAQTKYDTVSDLASGTKDSDIIIIAAPISAAVKLIEDLTKLKPKALILDICSLKTPLIPAIRVAEKKGLQIGSVHPMFGPQVDMLSGRNILICDTGNKTAHAEAFKLFQGTTANLVSIPLEEHDKLMAYVLGLSHFINLVYADVLATSGVSAAALKQVASTTFTNQTAVARAVVAENPNLYYEIQAENAFTPDIIAALKRSLEDWFNDIDKRDRAKFISRMSSADAFMSTDRDV